MPATVVNEKQDYLRLVAFWVVCEAFAGGIIHAIKLPFSGMIISSLAVFCIVMIGKYFPKKGNIIKATILVCIFKLMLSPHSPPTAYIAVLFQGLAGELLFRLKLRLRIASMLLAFLALVESAIQRILVLWILYGSKFWDAVDKYLEKFSGSGSAGSLPAKIALGYIILHAITGLGVGYYISVLANNAKGNHFISTSDQHNVELKLPLKKRGRKKIKWTFVILWLVMASLLVYGYAFPSAAVISGKSALWVIFRAATIVMVWYYLISPLLMAWFRKKMESSKGRNMESFQIIHSLLPSTQKIFYESWNASSNKTGLKRLHKFLQLLTAGMVPTTTQQ